MQNEWRLRNPHNETFMGRMFDISKVTVGRYTYGILNCYTWGKENEHLSIGHYCSIADDVVFLLGGNHNYYGITTFPCKVKFMGHAEEAETKGPIIIGDDVWIGYRATILSGVTIGQGAIIGAGSVVSRNVPPYAIAVGSPLKIIDWRFPPDIINELLKLNWSKVTPKKLKNYCSCELEGRLCDVIDNVKKIIKTLMED